MVTADEALPGREERMPLPGRHEVLGTPLEPPFPKGLEHAGGYTPNPTYEEVCSGLTGHAEVVLVVFDPERISYDEVLRAFWEAHDPTQGMRQGNDVGTHYRSLVLWTNESQREAAEACRDRYEDELRRAGFGEITTEIERSGEFYYAEPYHQQYLAKNPNGYCGLGGTGVACPVDLTA